MENFEKLCKNIILFYYYTMKNYGTTNKNYSTVPNCGGFWVHYAQQFKWVDNFVCINLCYSLYSIGSGSINW